MKKRKRKGLKVQDSKNVGKGSRDSSGTFHEIKSTPRGLKGPKRKKLLPPWRAVRSEV